MRPKPVGHSGPVELGINPQDIAALRPSKHQSPPLLRISLTEVQPAPAEMGVQSVHLIQKIGEQGRISNPRFDDRVALLIHHQEGIIAFASASPLDSHCGRSL